MKSHNQACHLTSVQVECSTASLPSEARCDWLVFETARWECVSKCYLKSKKVSSCCACLSVCVCMRAGEAAC